MKPNWLKRLICFGGHDWEEHIGWWGKTYRCTKCKKEIEDDHEA